MTSVPGPFVRVSGWRLVGAIGLLFVTAAGVHAQPSGRNARIGYLTPASLASPEFRESFEALRDGLRERGYAEGRNLTIEARAADGRIERLPRLADELVRLNVDVIVTGTTPAARAAQRATRTIPIVAVVMGDPVGDGLVASLARPGGNITGNTFLGPELVPKRLELLKEALPTVSRVAALWHPGAFGDRATTDMMKSSEAAARRLGVQLQFVRVGSPEALDDAFVTMLKGGAEALLGFPSPMLFAERKRLVALAEKHRVPAMFNAREFVKLGGLIAYGARLTDLWRRGAVYVDAVLKGTKPADLPIEQPTTFELVVNLKTARALGVSMPTSLLLRADEVIE